MIERRVSAWAVASVVLWVLSVATVAASFAWAPVATVGLLLGLAALTVTVRYWIGAAVRHLDGLFDLGRDVGRAESGGRVHSVR